MNYLFKELEKPKTIKRAKTMREESCLRYRPLLSEVIWLSLPPHAHGSNNLMKCSEGCQHPSPRLWRWLQWDPLKEPHRLSWTLCRLANDIHHPTSLTPPSLTILLVNPAVYNSQAMGTFQWTFNKDFYKTSVNKVNENPSAQAFHLQQLANITSSCLSDL